MTISIIVPSLKKLNPSLLACLKDGCPVEFQVIVADKRGLSYGRNQGALKAKHDLLMFMDDDIFIYYYAWNFLLDLKKREVKMPFSVTNFPCSRIMVIHKSDFWDAGGFDEGIRFCGEDLDFYLRARHKLRFIEIPKGLFFHQDHKFKRKKYHFDRGYLLLKHGCSYLKGDIFIKDYMRRPIKGLLLILGFYHHFFRRFFVENP